MKQFLIWAMLLLVPISLLAVSPISGNGAGFVSGTITTSDAAADNMIAPTSTSKKSFVLQLAPSQIANGLEVQSSAGAVLFSISPTGVITSANGTLINAMTDTWNNSGTAFVGLGMDITDTASAASALPLRIRGGAAGTTTLLSLSKAGLLTPAAGLSLPSSVPLTAGFGGTFYLLANGETLSGNSPFIDGGNSDNLTFGTNNTNRWRLGVSTGHLYPIAAYDLGITSTNPVRNIFQSGYLESVEMAAPAAGAANTGRIFLQDNGSGKTQLMVQFATGAAQQIAIEP